MSSPLERLPSEVVLQICRYIDGDRPSLSAFALVDKRCRSVAIIVLFHTVKIIVQGPKQLAVDVSTCIQILQRNSSFDCVHRLVVRGMITIWHNNVSEHNLLPLHPESKVILDLDEPSLDNKDVDYHFAADDMPPEAVYHESKEWEPLVELIRQLPALSDVVYTCPNQFAPCLLQALHLYRPTCRLHVRSFALRSLSQPVPDAHELALVTSPCLSSIIVRYTRGYLAETDQTRMDNVNREGVLRIAVALAPNLTDVYASRSFYVGDEPENSTTRPWSDRSIDSLKKHSTSTSLQRLQLGGVGPICRREIETWRTTTTISTLRVLQLTLWLEPDALELLATECVFPHLTTLVFSTPALSTSTEEWWDHAKCFLRQLPPLSDITLSGDKEEMLFHTILKHHGPTLRRLSFTGNNDGHIRLTNTKRTVEKIRDNCPLLNNLHMHMPRSRGNAHEVAVYKELGTLSRLQHLTLNLSAFGNPSTDRSPMPTDRSFGDDLYPFGSREVSACFQIYRGLIYDALINGAVDETLARSIFSKISTTKADSALPLEELNLTVYGGGLFHDCMTQRSFFDVVQHLGRLWRLVRNPRDDRRDEIMVTEVDKAKREARAPPIEQLTPGIEPLFRKLWSARRPEGSDWRDDWHSFPLAQG